MKRLLFALVLACAALNVSAQSNRTVETQKDRYGHVTGTPDFSAKNIYIFNYLIMKWL